CLAVANGGETGRQQGARRPISSWSVITRTEKGDAGDQKLLNERVREDVGLELTDSGRWPTNLLKIGSTEINHFCTMIGCVATFLILWQIRIKQRNTGKPPVVASTFMAKICSNGKQDVVAISQ
ncbi:hypothetical protein, partial [Halomonas ventosae]|uniref:hypothetical protein n=1 Tax=Halomonas ventosae TaxID=229007 RepID=UPI001AACA6F1